MAIYNYTYRITNKKLSRHYYGVRSSNVAPHSDLGITYFSSSYDKEFMLDQKLNSQDYKYKVVRIFDTRKEAADFEIRLHRKFDVGANVNFYNQVIQTSSGFDNTGRIFSEEHKVRMSEALSGKKHPMFGRTLSEEHKAKTSKALKGRVFSEESRLKMSEAQKGKIRSEEAKAKMSESAKGEKNHRFGKPVSAETRAKRSIAMKGKFYPKKNCECCNKLIAVPHYNRHFIKCATK